MWQRRFWTSVSLGIVLVLLHASYDYVGGHGYNRMWIGWLQWTALAIATIAVFWCGHPLFSRILARKLDAAGLAAIAAAGIYSYGLLAQLVPELWPREWRDVDGMVPMRFELASGAMTLALLVERMQATREGR